MTITLDQQYFAVADDTFLGYSGETNSRTISFVGLDNVTADIYSIVFSYGDGVTYESAVTGGSLTLSSSILRKAGTVDVQIYACDMQDDEYTVIKKSNILELVIKPSLDDNALPLPAPDDCLRLLGRIEQCAAALADVTETIVSEQSELDDSQQGIRTKLLQLLSEVMLTKGSAGLSKKNLLHIGATDKQINGIDFTVNDDGSVSLDGTSGALYTSFLLTSDTELDNIKHIPNGSYILCTNSLVNCKVYVTAYKYAGGSTVYQTLASTDGSKQVSFTVDDEYDYNYVEIYADPNSTFDSFNIKPMIRYEGVADAQWEPFTPSLQQQIDQLKGLVGTGYNEVQSDTVTDETEEVTT